MRRLFWMLSGVVLAVTSCSATLATRGTAPSQLNDAAACTLSPILTPATTLQVVHARVIGTVHEDSVSVMPGLPFNFSWQVPAGSYSVRVWASISGRPDLVGCDTTAVIVAPAKPHKPTLL